MSKLKLKNGFAILAWCGELFSNYGSGGPALVVLAHPVSIQYCDDLCGGVKVMSKSCQSCVKVVSNFPVLNLSIGHFT